MNLSKLNSRISFYTGVNTLSYTYLDRTNSINNWYNKVHTMILASQDEWDFDDLNNTTDFAIGTTSLVASQADYSLPTTLLKIKRVEISYDGNNWYRANPIDINEIGEDTSTSSIADNFSQSTPYYDIQGNSIVLYPIPNANRTACLKIWYDRYITEFSYTSESSNDLLTGTKILGIDTQFHDMISIGASLDWAIANGKDNISSLTNLLNDFEARLRDYYGSKQKDRQIVLKPAYENFD